MTASKASVFPAAEPDRCLRVLLVDDTPEILRDLRQLLELTDDLDIVGEAANGAEAVRLATDLAPDVVVMDLEMPGMDGYEATRRIKNKTPALRVIILSIHAGLEERRHAHAAGADCFVVKGEGYEVLVNAIRGTGELSNGWNNRKGNQR